MSKRNLEQNACFHKWCRVIAKHCQIRGEMLSEETIKQLVTRHFGNVKLIDNLPGIPADFSAMSTTKYKKTDDELTEFDRTNNYVSMSTLLSRMEAWAATDLELDLKEHVKKRPEEQSVEEWLADYEKAEEKEREWQVG